MAFAISAQAAIEGQPIGPSKPSQAELAVGRQAFIESQNAMPLEWRHVSYFATDQSGSSLSPAYVDLGTMTAYSWTGVVLQPDQIPRYFTKYPNGGSGLVFSQDPTTSKLQFKEIDPPTFYMLLPDGKYAAGYFDNGNGIYYRWGDLEFDKSQLPADAASKNRILPLHAGTVSTIAPPSKDAKKSPGAATQTPLNDQTLSASDQAATSASPQPALPPQTPKPIAEVAPASDTGIPWWLYAIIVFSIAAIIGAGYYLSKRSGKGP